MEKIVFVRNLPVPSGKDTADVLEDRQVGVQRKSKHLGDQVPRHVVGGGPESTGRDDQIGPAEALGDGLADSDRGVGHGDLAGDGEAGIGKAATEPLLMGVQDAAQHQLGAGIDDFDLHGFAG